MLRLSKKIDYGLILLQGLCLEPEAASARELAQRHRLPHPMVANILKTLAQSGILASTRGAQGGYHLAQHPSRITLAQIAHSLEGPMNLVDCVAGHAACEMTGFCPTQKPMLVVQQRFQDFLNTLTLDVIVSQPSQTPVGQSHANTYLPG